MATVLVGSLNFTKDETNFNAVMQRLFPEKLVSGLLFPVVINEEDIPFGSSDNTYFNAALVEVVVSLLGKMPPSQI